MFLDSKHQINFTFPEQTSVDLGKWHQFKLTEVYSCSHMLVESHILLKTETRLALGRRLGTGILLTPRVLGGSGVK